MVANLEASDIGDVLSQGDRFAKNDLDKVNSEVSDLNSDLKGYVNEGEAQLLEVQSNFADMDSNLSFK